MLWTSLLKIGETVITWSIKALGKLKESGKRKLGLEYYPFGAQCGAILPLRSKPLAKQ